MIGGTQMFPPDNRGDVRRTNFRPAHDPDDCAKAGGGCANPTSPMGLGPAIEEWIRLIVRQEIEAAFPRCPTCLTRGGHAPECGIHHR